MLKGFNNVGGDVYAPNGLVSGTNYQFVTTADIDYQIKKGANHTRIVFGWEAIQPGPLATIPSEIAANATYFAKLKGLVDYATSKGLEVVLDIHPGPSDDFAAYYKVKVGGTYGGTPVADLLVDFWTKMAAIFKSNPKVHIGFANEPNGSVTAPVWFACVQKIITSVRNAGFTGWLLPPGVNWTHAVTWVSSGSAAEFKKLVDPLGKLAFQVHEYADPDAGGATTGIVSDTILIERLKPAVDWARANGCKMWMGEIGFQSTTTTDLDDRLWAKTVEYLRANQDVVLGWCWWAYGVPSWWGSYRFAAGPKTVGGADSPQMDLIEAELAKVETVRFPPVAPDYKKLYDEAAAQLASLQGQLAAASGERDAAMRDLATQAARIGAMKERLGWLEQAHAAAQVQLNAAVTLTKEAVEA